MARSPGSGVRRGVAPKFAAARPLPPLPDSVESVERIAAVTEGIGSEIADALKTPATVHYTDKFAPVPKLDQVVLDQTTVEDIDQLWDWVRSDADGTTAFLGGGPYTNSRDLFTYIQKVAEMERNGNAKFYSIRDGEALLGFIMLNPIYREAGKSPVGVTHIYVEPAARGRLQSLLPRLLQEADRLAPSLNLSVITTRPEWAAVLESVGFSAQTVLTRQSSTGDAHG